MDYRTLTADILAGLLGSVDQTRCEDGRALRLVAIVSGRAAG
jgi:hypothetical protein